MFFVFFLSSFERFEFLANVSRSLVVMDSLNYISLRSNPSLKSHSCSHRYQTAEWEKNPPLLHTPSLVLSLSFFSLSSRLSDLTTPWPEPAWLIKLKGEALFVGKNPIISPFCRVKKERASERAREERRTLRPLQKRWLDGQVRLERKCFTRVKAALSLNNT